MSWPLRKSSSSSLSSSNSTNPTTNPITTATNTSASNPINRQSSASCNLGLAVPRSVQLDFDKEEKKIQELELTNKKFYKDVKSYVLKIDELNKSESKLISNLSNLANQSSITNSILTSSETTTTTTAANITISTTSTDEDKEFLSQLKQWKDLLNDHNASCDHLKQSCQQQVIEPMKKLNSLFPQVYEAIKRRQQAYNEFTRQQSKLDKALEKERTGPQIVRNEQLNQLVQNAKQQFDREHSLLMEELPKLYNSRVDYIRPCVQALLESQANFYDNYTSFYESILECHKSDSIVSNLINKDNNRDDDDDDDLEPSNNDKNKTDNEIDDEIQKCLNEIKSLSIVAGD